MNSASPLAFSSLVKRLPCPLLLSGVGSGKPVRLSVLQVRYPRAAATRGAMALEASLAAPDPVMVSGYLISCGRISLPSFESLFFIRPIQCAESGANPYVGSKQFLV